MLHGIFHPYRLEEAGTHFQFWGGGGGIFIHFYFIHFQIEMPVSKQWSLIRCHVIGPDKGDFKNNASISLIIVYRLSKADLLLKLILRYVINVFLSSCQVSSL